MTTVDTNQGQHLGHAHGSSTTLRVGGGADDPVTGPLPVVTMLDGRLDVREQKGVFVVTMDGGLDAGLAADAAVVLPTVLAGVDAAALDFGATAILDEDSARALVAAFVDSAGVAETCLVTARVSGRLVLEKLGVTRRLAVFGSVADALQARAFAENGYGAGWATEA